jgi:hypothetical protein
VPSLLFGIPGDTIAAIALSVGLSPGRLPPWPENLP